MSVTEFLSSILDPVFGPLLNIHPFLAILIVSFILSLIMVVMYKYLTNQNLMKELKNEIKELQKEMKLLKDKPKEMMEVQSKAMKTNMKYMSHSFRPTLFTFIPIIIIFAWLQAHMAYYPLVEGEQFSSTLAFKDGTIGEVFVLAPEGLELLNDAEQKILNNEVKFVFRGNSGEYNIKYVFEEKEYPHKAIITKSKNDRKYVPVLVPMKNSNLKTIMLSNEKIKPIEGLIVLGSIPWINGFGWLGTYFILSLIFSLGLRKILKVY